MTVSREEKSSRQRGPSAGAEESSAPSPSRAGDDSPGANRGFQPPDRFNAASRSGERARTTALRRIVQGPAPLFNRDRPGAARPGKPELGRETREHGGEDEMAVRDMRDDEPLVRQHPQIDAERLLGQEVNGGSHRTRRHRGPADRSGPQARRRARGAHRRARSRRAAHTSRAPRSAFSRGRPRADRSRRSDTRPRGAQSRASDPVPRPTSPTRAPATSPAWAVNTSASGPSGV